MRLVAALLTLIALGLAGLAGQGLYEVLRAPHSDVQLATVQAMEPQTPEAREAVRQWPALFGEPQPPAPPEPAPQPPTPEPQPPVQPHPPLSSLGYQLNGVVRAGDAVWAIVSHPTGERLLRVGDELAEGLAIAKIDAAGLWVSAGDGPAELLEIAK